MELSCPFQQPDARPIAERLYRLTEDYCYCWDNAGIENRIVVPAGFTYDGASVPRIVWTLTGIRPDGLIRAAALIHDWIYLHAGRINASHEYRDTDDSWRTVYGRWRRKDTDRLFARMMREASVSKWRRRAAYLAVRTFGWLAWDS